MRSGCGAPGAGGVVVGVGGSLRWAEGFGDVAEVDADAVPDVGGAALAVDEDVVGGEVLGGFGVGDAPAVQAGFGGGAVGGLGDDDEGNLGVRRAGALRAGFVGVSGAGSADEAGAPPTAKDDKSFAGWAVSVSADFAAAERLRKRWGPKPSLNWWSKDLEALLLQQELGAVRIWLWRVGRVWVRLRLC